MRRIYALVDEIGAPRYVGQTKNPLRLRLQQHQSAARTLSRPLDLWLRECPEASIIVLENDPVDADEAERRWIKQMREGGVSLLNLYEGGRRSPTGQVHTAEARRRISAARKGKPLSADHRAKLAAAHEGVPLSDKHREAIGNAQRGIPKGPRS